MNHSPGKRGRKVTGAREVQLRLGVQGGFSYLASLLSMAPGLVICTQRLNADLWYDEAYTLVHYVSRPWWEIVSDYSAPNNHILYSLLLRPLYILCQEETFLRIPGLLWAAGTLALVYAWTKHLTDEVAAVLATLWLGLTQSFLTHVMELRGYGLSIFLTALACWLGLTRSWATSIPSRLVLFLLLLSVAGMIYTIPTNLVVAIILTGLIGYRELQRATLRLSLFSDTVAASLGILVGILLYLPVRHQIIQAARLSQDWSLGGSFVLLKQLLSAVFHDWWPLLPLVVVGWILLIRKETRPRRRSVVISKSGSGTLSVLSAKELALWCLIGTLGPFILMGVLGIRPFVRHFLPCLIFLAVASGVGLRGSLDELLALFQGISKDRLSCSVWLCGRSQRKGRRYLRKRKYPSSSHLPPGLIMAVSGGVLLLVLGLASHYTYPRRLALQCNMGPVQDGYYNYYAANYQPAAAIRFVSQDLAYRRTYAIVFALNDYYPLAYYLAMEGVPQKRLPPEGLPEVVYFITTPHNRSAVVGSMGGLPPELLGRIVVMQDFGYYCVEKLELSNLYH
jgi:hypothetical protein